MIGCALRREDALQARLSGHRQKIARSRALLSEMREQFTAPWVAFSGGKDSLVTLALATVEFPEVTALWTDDELEYPEQPAYIPATCATLGAALMVKTGTQRHAGWFTPWVDAPFWREPNPGALVTGERAFRVRARLGGDVMVLGVRKAESSGRRIGLSRWGQLHESAERGWTAHPIADWTTADVWAFIGDRELPYNPVYDTLARIGVPRDQQRVGPLPLTPGWMLRDGWPETWRKLEERYGHYWP